MNRTRIFPKSRLALAGAVALGASLAVVRAEPGRALGPAVPADVAERTASPATPPATRPADPRPAPAAPALAPASPLAARRPPAASVAAALTPEQLALLGPQFEDPVQGLSFRGPVGSEELHKSGEDDVAEFSRKEDGSVLRVTRLSLSEPRPLSTSNQPGSLQVVGLLEYTVGELQRANPGAEILRGDVTSVGENWVGVIMMRYSLGTQNWLRMQALVQANDQLYYVFNLTTPAGKAKEDASEVRAVNTFNSVLESTKLLDRSWIKLDQNERLLRTRALLLDWKSEHRLTQALVRQQWLRIIKDGKDIGWSYVEEMTGRDRRAMNGKPLPLPRNPEVLPDGTAKSPGRVPDDGLISDDGLVVYARTWTRPEGAAKGEGGDEVNRGSEMFVSYDGKLEQFAHVATVMNKDELKSTSMEVGRSARNEKRVFDLKDPQLMGVRDAKDARAPLSRMAEVYNLDVQLIAKSGNGQPIHLELAPWYLPEALAHLLPRLVPLREPRTYLFASFVSEKRVVMHRYVDVGPETRVNLGGQVVAAVPVSERLGLKGTPTIHYMSPTGKYLGSVNQAQGVTVLPTDSATLEKMWPDADLRTEQIEAPTNLRGNFRADGRDPVAPGDGPRPLVRPRLGTSGGTPR